VHVIFGFIGFIKIMLLSLPATVTALLARIIVEPGMRRDLTFIVTAGYCLFGLVATEVVVRWLGRKSTSAFLNTTTKQWMTQIRISQATGFGCVFLCYFVMK